MAQGDSRQLKSNGCEAQRFHFQEDLKKITSAPCATCKFHRDSINNNCASKHIVFVRMPIVGGVPLTYNPLSFEK